jgi:hypothetical protein
MEESGQMLMLRELEQHEWLNQMSCALKWTEHASRMRLIQASKESEMQNVELPTWFIMESKGGEDWLRPSHPLADEKVLEEVENETYAVATRVPACALWNLLMEYL